MVVMYKHVKRKDLEEGVIRRVWFCTNFLVKDITIVYALCFVGSSQNLLPPTSGRLLFLVAASR